MQSRRVEWMDSSVRGFCFCTASAPTPHPDVAGRRARASSQRDAELRCRRRSEETSRDALLSLCRSLSRLFHYATRLWRGRTWNEWLVQRLSAGFRKNTRCVRAKGFLSCSSTMMETLTPHIAEGFTLKTKRLEQMCRITAFSYNYTHTHSQNVLLLFFLFVFTFLFFWPISFHCTILNYFWEQKDRVNKKRKRKSQRTRPSLSMSPWVQDMHI